MHGFSCIDLASISAILILAEDDYNINFLNYTFAAEIGLFLRERLEIDIDSKEIGTMRIW